ncbi:TPA: colicin immunity protein Cui [Escherichia coli]|nr:colicin immunity protein Cui [Escherichia coli]
MFSYRTNNINVRLFLFISAGLLPLFIIFILCEVYPFSPILKYIYDGAKNYSNITSNHNNLMSVIMDLYSKTGILCAIIFCLLNHILIKEKIRIEHVKKNRLIVSCILSPVVCIFLIYIFMNEEIELSSTVRPWSLMSQNDFLLLFIYVNLYVASFTLTLCLYITCLIAKKICSERH